MNFFRKIKLKFVDCNQLALIDRFLKYSRYAIGDFVLDKNGLLLALWVTNWNENRLESKKENRNLSGLLQEIVMKIPIYSPTKKLIFHL